MRSPVVSIASRGEFVPGGLIQSGAGVEQNLQPAEEVAAQ